jgi:polysaccharide biosynthesis protein PslH
MKILVITQKPIFPINDGGKVAMKALENELKANFNSVYNATISTEKHTAENNLNIDLLLEIKTSQKWKIGLQFLFFGKKMLLKRFYNSKSASKLIDFIEEKKIETVIFDGFYACSFLEGIQKKTVVKCILRSHNIESEIWYSRSENNASFIKKFIFTWVAISLKNLETKIAKKVNQIWTLSCDDSLFFEKYIEHQKVKLIPIGFDVQKTNVDFKSNSFFMIGAMDWHPNREAVDFIIEKVLPLTKNKNNFSLIIAGKSMPKIYFEKKIKQLIIKDEILDLESFFKISGTLIAPILSGSGIRVKILDAMARGIPVITTKIGALGINKTGKETLFFAETPEDFYQMILFVQANEELVKSKSKIAQKYILDFHNPTKIANEIKTFLNEL